MPPRIPRKCLTLKAPKFQLPRFQLLGASDCDNPSAISKEQILAWQEQGIIEYLGETKDVRPFLESATCVVLPSSYKEGVPRVLLEAMSMGKAIITTNIAGCRECVAPPLMPYENLLIGQNGILIPPKDAQALSLAISLLLSNKLPHTHNALMQMGAKARELVKGRFDIARIVKCYKKAVRENSASGEQCGSVARYGKGTNAKFANLYHNAQSSHSPTANLRILEEKQTELESNKLDSSVQVDCHDFARAKSRNDDETQNLNKPTKDSRSFTQNTKNLTTPQAEAVEMRNRCFQAVGAGIYLSGNEQAHRAESAIYRSNATPNLVFVSNTCFGMYNFRLQVLKSLQKSGFTIHIIAPFDSSTQALQQEGFITHNLYLDSRSLNPLKDFRTITMLHKLLKRIRPALVFNYTIKPAIYSSSVCNFLKIPNIALITGLGYVFINDKGKTSSLKKRVLRSIVCKMYRFALSKTQEVWFLNNDDKQEFLFYKLIRQNQAFLLDSEGVDTEYFSPKSSDVKAEKQGEQEQGEQKEIIFLLVARMLWDKGVGEFVEAAKMVQDSIKEANKVESNGGGGITKLSLKIHFQLLGESDCENPSAISKNQILAWEKQGILEYLGSTKDVRPFLESATCVVLPSYREGVSVSLLEALSMGRPIITSNASGCKHLIKTFDNGYPNGFLCQVRDAKSLANAMQEFIALDSTARELMGQNAREFARKSYDIQRIIAHYHRATQEHCPKS
ncbi:glycosyltransferase [Helicobacter canis]|uniref:Glycosyl transferase family 1 domain-containing protein n=1 Tax=Helicobacter canis NCTC 12740 TaxID=1357399 RepID=V8CHV7_9HELI|nr:glycosyltransferase [Helicobacter canis]ETD26968.1 hypothetical protein HMPREF2087_01362 [Helicobacter canis NCTC 12740]